MKIENKIGSPCISINKSKGELAIRLLREQEIVVSYLKIKRTDNKLLIPVNDTKKSIEILLSNDIVAEECYDEFMIIKKVTRDELKKRIEELNGLSRLSYSLVGEIAILNLKDEDEIEQAKITAKILMEHFKNIKSVYGKIGTHDEFRLPRLIFLGGQEKTFTITKEYDLLFAVDISKAFFNSRLADEHRRVALDIKHAETILDMFTGVGGFCIHIASTIRGRVYCNDINPHAISLLNISVIMNSKRLLSSVYTLNLDAKQLPQILNKKFDAIIMNHPTNSIEYLDIADALIKTNGTIYLYVLEIGSREYTKQQIEERLLSRKNNYHINFEREVLDYSPSKRISLYKLIKKS